MAEATLKHCKESLGGLKRSCKSLQKSLEEDESLLKASQAQVGQGLGAYEALEERRKVAEAAVLAAQQHFQAVSAGLSSGAGGTGQEETLPAQKIGKYVRTYVWLLRKIGGSSQSKRRSESPGPLLYCPGTLLWFDVVTMECKESFDECHFW